MYFSQFDWVRTKSAERRAEFYLLLEQEIDKIPEIQYETINGSRMMVVYKD